ncbi:MAG: Uma2 family endonuclease [Planctomycetales bacterium]|nr:Uma2 family endonuclease [Planctomycetales bacterium]
MTANLLEQLAAGKAPPLVQLNLDQYHEMIRDGILPEGSPIELIDGFLIHKDRGTKDSKPIGHGPRHALVVKQLQELLSGIANAGRWHLSVQLPVTLTNFSEPEPDLAVIRGRPADYATRHPGPGDILLAIEVADTSLTYDRTTKLKLYASVGIPQYWIVNLRDNVVEVFEDPRPTEIKYFRQDVSARNASVWLRCPGEEAVAVAVSEIL